LKFRIRAPSRNSPERAAAAARVKDWTRGRFNLPQDAVVSVSQIECAVPGCPPLETVVMFWTEEQTRHHFKVFKPLQEVLLDDLPPAWLKDALAAVGGIDGGCC
jgi:hypothetical protein